MRKITEPALQTQEQALWRSVIQSTGSTLLLVLILLVLGGLYLSVSAKAASAGRLVISLGEKVDEVRQTHSEVTARHAEATSPHRMSELASSLGYRPAELEEIRFLETDLASKKASFQAPMPQAVSELRKTILSPAFTETLVDALKRMLGVGGTE
jgi:cell division protein FtsL